MSVPTLDELLENGPESVASQIMEFFAIEQSRPSRKGPYEIRCTFTPPGESAQKVLEERLRKEQAVPEAAHGIIEEIRKNILRAWGSISIGKLKFTLYHKGEVADVGTKGIYIFRNVAPEMQDMAPGGYGLGPEILTTLILSQHGQVAAMHGQTVAAYQAAMATNAELAAHIAAISTVRTVGSAGSDLGGLWQIVGLVGLAVAFPLLEEVAGKVGTTLPTMMTLLQSNVRNALKTNLRADAGNDLVMPVGQGDQDPDRDFGDAPVYEVGDDGEWVEVDDDVRYLEAPDPEALVEFGKTNPSWVDALVSAIREDTDFSRALMQKFLKPT